MLTIIVISNQSLWNDAQKTGTYTQSTIEDSLEAIGFIHAMMPEQTIEIANRHFTHYEDLVLLLIDQDKLQSGVKFEVSASGGRYPHIYGPLNISSVYDVIPLLKDTEGQFMLPPELSALIDKSL